MIDWKQERAGKNYCGYCTGSPPSSNCDGSCFNSAENMKNNKIDHILEQLKEIPEEIKKLKEKEIEFNNELEKLQTMEQEKHKKISKNLSYWLRHKPEKIGITLDKEGWTDVAELIEKAKAEIEFNIEELKEVVAESDKQRFALSEDGTKIRANQGHSVDVKIKFKEIAAPPVLYHGTVGQFMDSINKKGLIPGKRHHVHLSKDKETAEKVGSRRGTAIILKIDSMKMQDDGFRFYISENGVYLTDFVPSKYIKR